jgi:hypothetical protein
MVAIDSTKDTFADTRTAVAEEEKILFSLPVIPIVAVFLSRFDLLDVENAFLKTVPPLSFIVCPFAFALATVFALISIEKKSHIFFIYLYVIQCSGNLINKYLSSE